MAARAGNHEPELETPGIGSQEKAGAGTKPVAGRPWTYVGNAWRPTMTIYPPKGENTHAALMVYPGGGYQVLAIDLEGTEICDWATSRGMTCVVLKYRVPQTWWHKDCGNGHKCQRQPNPFLPLQDAQRAMGLLRQRAAGLGRRSAQDRVIGFFGRRASRDRDQQRDRAQLQAGGRRRQRSAPAPISRCRSTRAISGPAREPSFSRSIPIRADCPPTFMVQCQDDPVDDVRNSIAYFLALRESKVPARDAHLRRMAATPSAPARPPTDHPLARARRDLAAHDPRPLISSLSFPGRR